MSAAVVGTDPDARLRFANAAAVRSLFGAEPIDGADELRRLADYADGLPPHARTWDRYGQDGPVAYLESIVAELLDLPAAAFFPSGIMAQQIALRIWSDRAGHPRVALPELSHLLLHEDDGPRIMQNLDIVLHTRGERVCRSADVAAVEGPLAAVLVELPLRDGGYLLPTWDELVELSSHCRARGIPLHVDGARLWEAKPYLEHDYHQIAALADSVYVSFYKGLAGFSGAVLAGDADFVEQARLWRHRMGGTVFRSYPLALAALRGLDFYLPQVTGWVSRAHAVAAALRSRGIEVTPFPPHTNAFRVYAGGSVEELTDRTAGVTERTGVRVFGGWATAGAAHGAAQGDQEQGAGEDARVFAEATIGPASMAWDVTEIAELVASCVGDGTP